MIAATCHCGAVRLEVSAPPPTQLTSCNCSICRRLGSLTAYYPADAVRVTGETVRYVWGDRTIAFHHCGVCGCFTHWSSLDPERTDRMGVNACLMEPTVIEGVCIRRLDGAETWEFLD